MVACLEKTEGNYNFYEIVDFLAFSLIHHALTVSPPIYTSYIKQFWNTASSQTVNDVKQINATVDSKAVVVTEASIRSSLLFNDADGTACLTNEAIFQNLALMGYEGDFNKLTFQKALFSPQWKFLIHTILHCLSSKSTSWNEFSTNIASAVICLATNQKFNFSKLIFDGMLRNLDNTKKKFLMYPRFLMVFLNNQIELGEPFNDVYPTPAHNLKVFTNMSRKGLKFSGKITPLFPNMLTHAAEGEGSGEPTEPQPTPSPTQPSTGDQPPETSSSHATTQDSRDSLEGTNGNEGDQVQTPHDSPLSGGHTSDRAEGALNLQELSVLCTNLSNRVLALESIKDAQAAEIKCEQINATVDSKAVVVTEASIRSSLLFNDADGTACLTNEAIFQNLALMGYEGDFNKLTFQKALFSPQWKFLIHTILHCLSSKSTSWNEFSTNIASAVICLATNQKFNFSKLIFDGMLRNLDNTKKKFLMYPRFLMVFLNNQIELGEPFNDVYPTPAHNLKVFTNMSRKGLKFLGKITPLFPNMLTHAAEGEGSGEPTKPQPTPSPTQPSIGDQIHETSSSHATTQDFRDSLEETNGNEGDQVQTHYDSPLSGGHTSDRAEEISALKIKIKKLEKKCKPSISYHRAWLKECAKTIHEEEIWKEGVCIQTGEEKSKPESTLDDSTVFDDPDADHGMEYIETEEAVDEGRQSGETEEVKLTDDIEVVEDKGSGDKGGNVEELVSTARPEVSTTRPDIDAARQEDNAVKPRTPPTTTSIFDDEDITMAQTLIKMKEEKAKEKGVSIKDVDDSSRPERSILTLKPLPTIDPKDKGKGVLKESPVKKVKRSDLDAAQIAKDAEIARLVHEKELAEMEREREERQRQDQASVDYIASLYDEVQAKMDASEELAARLQMEEREMYTIEERSKLLAEFFERRKKLLAEERAAAVRNKPPTRTQLRSLMMTYLKHTGKYRHNQLNKKTFEEIQALYIKEQERDADFVPIGSERDEKMIDKMNKKAAGMDEEEVPEEPDSTKVEVKQEGTKKRKLGTRKKMKSRKRRFRQGTSKGDKTNSDIEKENNELRLCLTIISDEDKEVDYEILDKKYEDEIPKGFDRVLWGDLMIMFNPTDEDEFWNSRQDWNVYPLRKKVLLQMLELKLESEEDSIMALELIRFVKKKCGALRELMHSAFIGTLAVSFGSLNECAAHLQYCAAILGTRSEVRRTREKCVVLWHFLLEICI
ncbi:hypothetical protein Tco_0874393 [Tanacetum coccineum]|uniref:Synaptobrevin, longin-like domain protein n=1 Tax=Tanacetum coccineum TaxID=301880 RepID=A0ABQ5BPG5_9ASTR